MEPRPPWLAWAGLAVIILAVLVVYWPARHFEFLNYDDVLYVTDNPVVKHGLTWPGTQWAFTTMHASNWHPLTWLSHMIDVEWFGHESSRGHRMMNILMHTINIALLFAVLFRMTGSSWRSVLVAGLFALHPLRVESVAWVAERKDVLSTLFGLAAIWFYAGFANKRRWSEYALMVVCFGLSLLAKPMLVTLPCVLLLLDYWPLGRWNKIGGERSAMQLVIEKLPLLAFSALSAYTTVTAQQLGGSMSPLEHIAIDQRIENAVVAYASYIGMFLWPTNLAVLYPHPGEWETWRVTLSALVLAAVSALVASAARRKRPALLVGWLWYLGTLVPVIGLVQVGLQAMADRYSYVPQIGLAIMLAWSVPTPRAPSAARIAAASSALVLVTLAWLTSNQLQHWRNSVTLFSRAVAVTSDNFIAEHNLAKGYEERGDAQRAIERYRKALAIKPDYFSAHNNLGLLLSAYDADASVEHLRRAAELRPDSAVIRSNYGLALEHRGMLQEAEAELRKAVELDPRDAQTHLNLARFFYKQKRFNEAIDEFVASLLLNPDVAEAHCELGDSLAHVGDLERAIAHLEAAIKLKPDFERARFLHSKATHLKRELINDQPR